MQLTLFVSEFFARSAEAQRIWARLAEERGLPLSVLDINSDSGRAAAQRLGVSVVPALALNDRLLAIGVPTLEEGRTLLVTSGQA